MFKLVGAGAGLLAMIWSVAASAEEKETWKGPFGGSFTAGMTIASDYSYRGISQTTRSFAFQPTMTYETASFTGDTMPVSAYGGFWASNVNFPDSGTAAEIDILAGFRAKAMNSKLTFDLGYIRYSYLGSNSLLYYDFSEWGLVAGYDFDVVQVSGAVRYSPNFFANSGAAWYKWAQVTVPLPFIKINDNISFKAFGAVGSQYVERNANYGIPYNNYWDWQIGVTATVYGFDLTAAYTDTNIEVDQCLGTQNCAARVIFSISKTF